MKFCIVAITALVFCSSALGQQSGVPDGQSDGNVPEVLIYQSGFDSKRSPEGFFDGVARIVNNPVTGPAVVAAAIYFGVPPDVAIKLGSTAAAVGSAAARETQTNPTSGTYGYSYSPPEGYSVCAVKIEAISIMPGRKDRPRIWASGSKNGVSFTVRHQRGAFGSGRSKVKLVNTFMVVRNDVYSSYTRCALTDTPVGFINGCRGSDCARYGEVNRWYPNP